MSLFCLLLLAPLASKCWLIFFAAGAKGTEEEEEESIRGRQGPHDIPGRENQPGVSLAGEWSLWDCAVGSPGNSCSVPGFPSGSLKLVGALWGQKVLLWPCGSNQGDPMGRSPGQTLVMACGLCGRGSVHPSCAPKILCQEQLLSQILSQDPHRGGSVHRKDLSPFLPQQPLHHPLIGRKPGTFTVAKQILNSRRGGGGKKWFLEE